MSFPLTAEQSMKIWNDRFPMHFKDVQQYSYTMFVVWRNQLTSSNVRYLNSLGFDALHFNPMVPFSQGEVGSIYEKGFLQSGYILKLWREEVDFYVIYQSLHMMTRAKTAAIMIQRCYRNSHRNNIELEIHSLPDNCLYSNLTDSDDSMPSLEPLSNDINLADFDDNVVERNLSTHLYGDEVENEVENMVENIIEGVVQNMVDEVSREDVEEDDEEEGEEEDDEGGEEEGDEEDDEEGEEEGDEGGEEEGEEERRLARQASAEGAVEEAAVNGEVASGSEDYSDDSGWGDNVPLVKSKSAGDLANNKWWNWD